MNAGRRGITADISPSKIHLDLKVERMAITKRKDKKTGKIVETVNGGVYVTFDDTLFRYTKVDGTVKEFVRKDTSIFTYTSKMVCPSFSLPAGPPPFGTCPASVEKAVASKGEYAHHLKPGDLTLGQKRTDYVCNVCYAGKGRYDPKYNPPTTFAQAIRLAWVKRMMEVGKGRGVSASESFANLMAQAIEMHISSPGIAEVAALKMINPHYFRIHDSGDTFIGSTGSADDYLVGWIGVAQRFWSPSGPRVLFWCPTRMWVYGWFVALVNQLSQQGMIPPNFILRPSALYIGMQPPNRATLGPGFASGSMCESGSALDEKRAILPQGVYDCPAYRGATSQHNCEAQGCRVCWEHPEVEVNYREH